MTKSVVYRDVRLTLRFLRGAGSNLTRVAPRLSSLYRVWIEDMIASWPDSPPEYPDFNTLGAWYIQPLDRVSQKCVRLTKWLESRPTWKADDEVLRLTVFSLMLATYYMVTLIKLIDDGYRTYEQTFTGKNFNPSGFGPEHMPIDGLALRNFHRFWTVLETFVPEDVKPEAVPKKTTAFLDTTLRRVLILEGEEV